MHHPQKNKTKESKHYRLQQVPSTCHCSLNYWPLKKAPKAKKASWPLEEPFFKIVKLFEKALQSSSKVFFLVYTIVSRPALQNMYMRIRTRKSCQIALVVYIVMHLRLQRKDLFTTFTMEAAIWRTRGCPISRVVQHNFQGIRKDLGPALLSIFRSDTFKSTTNSSTFELRALCTIFTILLTL